MIFVRNFLRLGAAVVALLLASCGYDYTAVSLDYQPNLGQKLPGPRVVGVGHFANLRPDGDYYLGSVSSPIGTPMESLGTRVPVDDIVRNAFAHALSSRGMLVPPHHAPYLITGEVIELHCQQYLHPSADARLRVNLVRTGDGRILYSRIYQASRQGDAYMPGSGSPVPVLKELMSRTLQNVVDQAVDDRGLRSFLHGSAAPSGDQ